MSRASVPPLYAGSVEVIRRDPLGMKLAKHSSVSPLQLSYKSKIYYCTYCIYSNFFIVHKSMQNKKGIRMMAAGAHKLTET